MYTLLIVLLSCILCNTMVKKKFVASHDSFTKTIDYKTIALVLNAVSSKRENETCVSLKLL